ncbi:MAG: hypothetical protein H6835_13495 [Planctomycetes bacterium]|nr:hypothetical protein [Planctomycetota bacterium]
MAGPRRWSQRLLLVANLAAANAVAAVWLVAFVRPALIGQENAPDEARAVRLPLDTPVAWLGLLGSVALLLANFAWLVRRGDGKPIDNWVISETPQGGVRVAREAIELALQKAGEAAPAVTRVRVKVDHRVPKRILVTAQYFIAEGQDHLAASQRLRHVLADRFAELVRLADGRRVEIELEFQGFLGKLSKRAAEPPPPSTLTEDDDPFTGPRYPADGDLGAGT